MSAQTNDFEKELWEEALYFHAKVKEGIIAIADDVYSRILRRTPFQTGYLLANWQIGAKRDTGKQLRYRRNKKKQSTTRYGATIAAQWSFATFVQNFDDPFMQFRIVNNAPYAPFVRTQESGAGMMELVLLSLQEVDAKKYEVI